MLETSKIKVGDQVLYQIKVDNKDSFLCRCEVKTIYPAESISDELLLLNPIGSEGIFTENGYIGAKRLDCIPAKTTKVIMSMSEFRAWQVLVAAATVTLFIVVNFCFGK